MQPLASLIRLNQSDAAVANLHLALIFLLKRLTALKQIGSTAAFPAKDQLALILTLRREQADGIFGPATLQAVRLLQFNLLGANEPSGEIDTRTADVWNQKLTEMGAFTPKQQYQVEGLVFTSEGAPVPNKRVSAMDKNLRGEERLGVVATNAVGFYEISYHAAAFTKFGKTGPDLFIRLEDTPTIDSSLRPLASPAEEIDLMTGAASSAVAGLPEAARLAAMVTPMLGQLRLADLKKDDQHDDFAWLEQQTGESAEQIRLLSEAHRIAPAGVDPEVVFAALRNGLSGSAHLLYAQRDQLPDLLKQAAEEGLIAPRTETQVSNDVEALRKQALGILLHGEGSTPGLEMILTGAGLQASAQQKFAELLLDHRGEAAALWEKAASDIQLKDHIPAIQFELQAGEFTGMYEPLMREIRQIRQSNRAKTPRDLAMFSAQTWRAMADQAGYPAEFPGDTPEQKAAGYARAVAANIEAVYPAEFYAHRLMETVAEGDTLGTFLSDNVLNREPEKALRLHTDSLERWLGQTPDALARIPLEQRAEVLKTVKRAIRLHRMCSNAEDAIALDKAGIRTALQVARMDGSTFVARFGGTLGDDNARRIHKRARQISATAMAAAANFNARLNEAQPAVMKNVQPGTAEINAFPTLQAMFGSADQCMIPHCSTAYGPPAYLTDVFHFLQDRTDTTGASALDILFSRRPDLEHLSLSCENTETTLPYIDLVNEILELAIAPYGEEEPVVPYQTGGTAAERAAFPQHLREQAYQPLKTAVFPLSLPFDFHRETVDRCLEQLELDRAGLQEALWNGPWHKRLQDKTIAFEYLGLSAPEATLITGAQPQESWECWGFATETVTDTDNQIKQWDVLLAENIGLLMQKAGVTYHELLQILDTWYVNPETGLGGSRQIAFNENPSGPACDTAQMRLLGLDAGALERLIRFVRLWRKLKWTVQDTDRAIRILGNNTLDDACLVAVSQLKRLQRHTNLPVEDLLVWWAPAEARRYWEYTSRGPVAIPDWHDKLHPLPSGETQEQMAAQLSGKALAKLLGANEEELGYWLKWSIPNPMDSPLEALQFLEWRDVFRQAGINSFDLRFLLNHNPVDALYPDRAEMQVRRKTKTILQGFQAGVTEALTSQQPAVNEEPQIKQALHREIFLRVMADAFAIPVSGAGRLADHFQAQYPEIDLLNILLEFDPELIADEGNPEKPEDAETLKQLLSLTAWFGRLTWVVQKFSLEEAELHYLMGYPALKFMELIHPEISYQSRKSNAKSWAEICRFVLLRRQLPDLAQTLNAIGAGDAAAEMEKRWGWQKGNVNALLVMLKIPKTGHSPEALMLLMGAYTLLKKTGLKPAGLKALAQPQPDQLVAQSAISMLQAQYDSGRWLEVLKNIHDPLRERRRDAMVDYLLANKLPSQIKDANDLYAHLLIDVEMAACQVTSRLKQAISSTQLFVQRCLFGLEPGVQNMLSDEAWKQWKWMKNYRVWEANRKVFLYPENWIEPGLRDDKSPFFEELENELLQNEITDEHAERALRSYLAKLDKVSRLEISAVYHQKEDVNGDSVDILHVFGRTRGLPHQYFYRRQVDQSYWTPWESVETDIEGDHLIPVIWNRRLYLFWPIFTEKQEETNVTMPQPGQTLPPGKKYKEIALAWSEYRDGGWAAKKMSTKKLTSKDHPSIIASNEQLWLFRPRKSNSGELYIDWLILREKSTNRMAKKDGSTPPKSFNKWVTAYTTTEFDIWILASFHFSSCSSEPSLASISQKAVALPKTTANRQLANLTGKELALPVDNQPGTIIIRQNFYTTENASLTFDHQDKPFDTNRNFFFGDAYRTYQIRQLPHFASPLAPEIKESGATNSSLTRSKYTAVQNVKPVYNLVITKPEIPAYRFKPHYHAFTCDFIRRLEQGGLDQVLNLETQVQKHDNFKLEYQPKYVARPYPVEEVELDMQGAYSLYNWELFFHIPMLMADHLSKNQRFEEAMRWYHFVFNPLNPSDTGADDASRYWQFRRFAEMTEDDSAMKRLEQLLDPESPEYAQTAAAIRQWRKNPFKPHLVARWRNSAYMRNVVMRYIDNLIAWGDDLFRRDTLESINEATQLYVLAAEILGEKPRLIPPRKALSTYTFAEIKKNLDEFSIFSQLENELPEQAEEGSGQDVSDVPGVWSQIFVLAPNDKLLGYWDTVADRLFKIRHCQNISGQVRQLPLFEPPIDPALLVRATQAGLSIDSVLRDISYGIPLYRFSVLSAKASELAAELRNLGASLLSAMEKHDAEHLSLLRSGQEIRLLEAVREIKVRQVNEAKEQIKSLEESRKTVEIRRDFYDGKPVMNISELAHLGLSAKIFLHLFAASGQSAAAGVLSALGNFKFGSPTTMGAELGPESIANALRNLSDKHKTDASILESLGGLILTTNSYARRKEEWNLQADIAKSEIMQLDRQILAAQIRLAIAEKDLRNHDLQVENAREADEYMRSKFTDKQLYNWMIGQISGMYFQAYQMALRMARQAQQALQYEVGQPAEGIDIIQSGYWDTLKRGLLAGDKLYQDIKRLETAYLDLNTRELELTKHISLQQLHPFALLKLREEGKCEFAIPEELFDLDFPGHYYRRIKSVSITIPCVAGPYTTVNATLRMNGNKLRKKPNLADPLEPVLMPNETNKIAVSSAQNDAGLFELNFRDERYLPFEGAGAVSTWELELMQEKSLRQFDYNTIADVIVHLRYTANEDGVLKTAAVDRLKGLTSALGEVPLQRLFSLRYDFPNEWHAWTKQNQPLSVKLEKRHFPYFAQMGSLNIQFIRAYPKSGADVELKNPVTMEPNEPLSATGWEWKPGDTLAKDREDWLIIVQYGF